MANIKDDLFNRYKLSSDEELKEITVANGYTEDAEQVAQVILSGDRKEYKEHIKQQEEKRKAESNKVSGENTIGGILKTIGFLVMVFGTIGSIYLATQGYGFEFGKFILPEIGTIISGMIFLGFSEIIQLLQNINNKLK